MLIPNWIETNQDMLIDISKQIWSFAELRFEEHRSAEVLADNLEEMGFEVERGVAGLPTAFVASYGSGDPVIAILGEYDALPGLSQEAVPYPQARSTTGSGHGCGHNLLGVGSLAASLAVKEAIQAGEISGTVRFYGCPAEEGGSGKGFMVKAGLFEDVDLSLCWHPSSFNTTMSLNTLAVRSVYFRFHGKTAHAAADPQNGRSALDAVELMNVGANYLREHISPEARLHYVITDGGGSAPNVVPASAEVHYYIRAPQMAQVDQIYKRVQDVARGAAMMTGTEVEFDPRDGCSNLVLNDTINQVLDEKLQLLGAPQFNQEEKEFARQIGESLPPGALEGMGRMLGGSAGQMVQMLQGIDLVEAVIPLMKQERTMPVSTDVGDVSWVTPTGQIGAVCQVLGTPGHSWQVTAQSGMGIGFRGMLYAGKVLGLTAAEFMQDPELLARAKAEFEQRTRDQPYISPIPDGVKPPV